ncbi:MAG: PAS domain S-box protein [Acidimicrobiia bacterium]|nr:PAS domain S-box protein [Acidimicrobiia bacterium]
MKRGIAGVLTALIILALTAFVDGASRSAYNAQVRAEVSAGADRLARTLSDAIVRESASVETLSTVVELSGGDRSRLEADFPIFAQALMDVAPKIRSVQLGPASILEYVFPLEGNEAALGLDLMADPDRRALLEPAIDSGETVIQGPVGLVQGGSGLIVRRAIYSDDGSFWGFAALVLDWPAIAADVGLEPSAESMLAGLMRSGDSTVIAGSPEAFEGDPVIRTLQVGATSTTWTLAMQPEAGWPTNSPTTATLWVAGILIAAMVAYGLFDLLGRPEAMRGEREKALEDLAHAEARYEATFQHAGVGILVVNTQGIVVSANLAFKHIVGIDADADAVGMAVADFVRPDDLESLEEVSRQLVRSGGVVERELPLLRSGEERWSRVQMTVFGDSTEAFFVGVIDDVTARRAAEYALAESEDRYRQLFQAAPIAIQRQDFSRVKARLDELRESGLSDLRALLKDDQHLVDLVGLVRVTDANPAAQDLNAELGSGSGRHDLRDLLSDEARESFVTNLMAVWDGDEFVSMLVSPVTEDGRQLHLDLRWQPVQMVDGVLDYSQVMLTISDVTGLTETQRRLEELLASKDRFLASVAHELRTPLTAVVGFSQELRDNDDLTPVEEKEFVALVAQNSVEMSHLIEDILVIARSEIGQVQVVPKSIDLAAEVESVLKLLPGHGLTLSESDSTFIAFADPGRVRQIVRNLVTNAIRYGGHRVSVEVGRKGDEVFVDVSDNGPPLPPGDTNRIFEPYQRMKGPDSVPGSIGLGLTVSRALARAQGGEVSARREGERNVFRLALPIADASVASSASTLR